jgi:hypothetical protein
MGNSDPQIREMMSRLALSCSALARAGQVLSTVTDPAKTAEALRQASAILESDARVSGLPEMEAVTRECQAAIKDGDPSGQVAVCRKLATKLARLASTLATEVQEQTRKAGKLEPKPATVSPSRPAVAPPSQAPPPAPVPSVSRVPAAATPSSVPVPPKARPAPGKRPARPKVDVARIRVAASVEEQAAVTAALETDERFAVVRNGTLIDVRTDLMWAAKVGAPGTHSSAEAYASQCHLGGYADWRLPRPEELRHFLGGDGRELGPIMFGAATMLWTSETRRRWFFIRQATVLHVRTASVEVVSARRSDVHVLVVRGAERR